MNKFLIALIAAVLFSSVGNAEDMVPPITAPTGSYVSGRKARIVFSYKTIPGTVIWCDIYRDGELYYSEKLGQKDAETNGAVWYVQSGKQYFIDNAIFLARSHVYTFVVRTEEGAVSEPVSLTLSFAQPAFAMNPPSGGSGRTVSLLVGTPINPGYFPDVFYEVYRDDDLLATIPQKGSGTTEKGDTWAWTTYQASLSFQDNNAYPGRIHQYRVVAQLFEGFRMELTGTGRVGVPSFVMGKPTQSGRTVKLNITTPISRSLFPELFYEVYRDGEKIGEIPSNGTITLPNGDGYSLTNSAGTYSDNNVILGEIYEYRLVAVLFPGCEMELTARVRTSLPGLSLANMTYSNGSVRLYWTPSITTDTYPGTYYEVHRDGESIGACRPRGSCTMENGNTFSWATTNTQSFVDNNVIPGRSYQYELSAMLYDDVRVRRSRIITVGLPTLSVVSSRYDATTARLQLPMDIHGFMPRYHVYRDGEKLAEFNGKSTGSTDQGCSWSYQNATGAKLDFREANLAADQNYAYRIVAVLTDDCVVEAEAFVDLNPSTVGNTTDLIVNDAYVPVIKRLSTGEYMFGASFRQDPANPDADVRVFLGGGNYLFLENGSVEATIPAAEFAKTGLANRYFLAPATINPNRTLVNIYATKVTGNDGNSGSSTSSDGN